MEHCAEGTPLRRAGERVLVMQATEDGLRCQELAFGQPVAMGLRFGWDSRGRLGNGTQCRVRPCAIVVRGPFARDGAQVSFAQDFCEKRDVRASGESAGAAGAGRQEGPRIVE